jgi:hypothetical protein
MPGVEILAHVAFDGALGPHLAEIEDADALDERLELCGYVASVILTGQSTSFAGTLLKLGGFESGIFHLYGFSSVGKTTCPRAAAATWGSGADGAYIRTWRTTANALETTLEAACDSFLPIDEVGQAEGRDLARPPI